MIHALLAARLATAFDFASFALVAMNLSINGRLKIAT